jgi:hypothetical protein
MNKPLLAWFVTVWVLLATSVGLFFARGASDVVSLSLMLITVFLVLIGNVPYKKHLAKQLTKKFKQVAEEMGMKFSEEGDSALLQGLGAFDLFGGAVKWQSLQPNMRITNVLHGDSEQLGYSEEFEVTILRYWHPAGTRDGIDQTVICFRSPELSLPQFDLRPEVLFHKIGSALGYQDIDFESHQTGAEFSKKYLLRGTDEQMIRTLFTDKILTFFAAHPDEVYVEGSGDQLILYRKSRLIEPENISAFMEEGLEVFRLFASSQPS